MNTSNQRSSRAMHATSILVAICALLAACDQVVTTANAQSPVQVATPTASNGASYFSDEYASVQQKLAADIAPPAPTF
jgi:hypothetical protein